MGRSEQNPSLFATRYLPRKRSPAVRLGVRAHGMIGVGALSLLCLPAAGQPDMVPYFTRAIAINSHVPTADDFPADSIRQGEQGTTGVRFLIGETGDVIECNVENSSGYARLDDAACSFVRRWKYKPATEGGKATTQIATANIEFRSGLGSVTDLLNFPNVSKGATLPPEPSGPSDPAMDVPNSYVPPPRGNR